MKTSILSALAVGVVASSAVAQSMNIDVGTATPTPGNSYGAAAGQAGVWNNFNGSFTQLADLSGSLTAATMTGTPGGFLGGFNDPGTFGDDEALMDDSLVIPFLETYTISNLAAGTYSVYVYGWTFNALPTQFNVNGTGFQTIGGAWPSGFQVGVTHAFYPSVTIAANQNLTIDVFSVNGALGGFSGVQLTQVPAPGALGLFVAGCAVRRRRRTA